MLECACKTCLPIKILEQNEGNVCGRLLVIVVEAENLQASSATGKNYIRLRFELGKRMNKNARQLCYEDLIHLPVFPLTYY